MQRANNGRFVRRTDGELFNGFGVFYESKGYPCIFIDGKNIKVHVYVWEQANGPKPKGMILHHKDFNRRNYSLENLELMSESDHRKLHAGWTKQNGQWVAKPCKGCGRILTLDNFYKRHGYATPCPLCKSCHIKRTTEIRRRRRSRE